MELTETMKLPNEERSHGAARHTLPLLIVGSNQNDQALKPNATLLLPRPICYTANKSVTTHSIHSFYLPYTVPPLDLSSNSPPTRPSSSDHRTIVAFHSFSDPAEETSVLLQRRTLAQSSNRPFSARRRVVQPVGDLSTATLQFPYDVDYRNEMPSANAETTGTHDIYSNIAKKSKPKLEQQEEINVLVAAEIEVTTGAPSPVTRLDLSSIGEPQENHTQAPTFQIETLPIASFNETPFHESRDIDQSSSFHFKGTPPIAPLTRSFGRFTASDDKFIRSAPNDTNDALSQYPRASEHAIVKSPSRVDGTCVTTAAASVNASVPDVPSRIDRGNEVNVLRNPHAHLEQNNSFKSVSLPVIDLTSSLVPSGFQRQNPIASSATTGQYYNKTKSSFSSNPFDMANDVPQTTVSSDVFLSVSSGSKIDSDVNFFRHITDMVTSDLTNHSLAVLNKKKSTPLLSNVSTNNSNKHIFKTTTTQSIGRTYPVAEELYNANVFMNSFEATTSHLNYVFSPSIIESSLSDPIESNVTDPTDSTVINPNEVSVTDSNDSNETDPTDSTVTDPIEISITVQIDRALADKSNSHVTDLIINPVTDSIFDPPTVPSDGPVTVPNIYPVTDSIITPATDLIINPATDLIINPVTDQNYSPVTDEIVLPSDPNTVEASNTSVNPAILGSQANVTFHQNTDQELTTQQDGNLDSSVPSIEPQNHTEKTSQFLSLSTQKPVVSINTMFEEPAAETSTNPASTNGGDGENLTGLEIEGGAKTTLTDRIAFSQGHGEKDHTTPIYFSTTEHELLINITEFDENYPFSPFTSQDPTLSSSFENSSMLSSSHYDHLNNLDNADLLYSSNEVLGGHGNGSSAAGDAAPFWGAGAILIICSSLLLVLLLVLLILFIYRRNSVSRKVYVTPSKQIPMSRMDDFDKDPSFIPFQLAVLNEVNHGMEVMGMGKSYLTKPMPPAILPHEMQRQASRVSTPQALHAFGNCYAYEGPQQDSTSKVGQRSYSNRYSSLKSAVSKHKQHDIDRASCRGSRKKAKSPSSLSSCCDGRLSPYASPHLVLPTPPYSRKGSITTTLSSNHGGSSCNLDGASDDHDFQGSGCSASSTNQLHVQVEVHVDSDSSNVGSGLAVGGVEVAGIGLLPLETVVVDRLDGGFSSQIERQNTNLQFAKDANTGVNALGRLLNKEPELSVLKSFKGRSKGHIQLENGSMGRKNHNDGRINLETCDDSVNSFKTRCLQLKNTGPRSLLVYSSTGEETTLVSSGALLPRVPPPPYTTSDT